MRHTGDLIGVLSLKHYTYIFNTATNLYSMFSSVHVISKEKKAGRCKNWAHPPQNFLKANQVVKIAVKVTWKKNSCKNSTKPLPSVLYWGQFSRETTSVLYESDPCFCTSSHKFEFKKSLYSSRYRPPTYNGNLSNHFFQVEIRHKSSLANPKSRR